MAEGFHPFPSRTRKLSPPAPMVLGERSPGRVGRRRFLTKKTALTGGLLCVFAQVRRQGSPRSPSRIASHGCPRPAQQQPTLGERRPGPPPSRPGGGGVGRGARGATPAAPAVVTHDAGRRPVTGAGGRPAA